MTVRKTSFQAIGTKWSIDASTDLTDGKWRQLLGRVQQRIDLFDKAYSRFRQDSWVAKLSRAAGEYELPPDGFQLLDFNKRLYEASGGKMTPLIGRTISDAGYDADYSLKPKRLSKPPAWDDVIAFDRHSLKLKRPALLDFGAAGKGYLVDIVGSLFDEAGIEDYVINAGGDIRHRGRPVDVGLENPLDLSQAIGVVRLGNHSLCASAGSRRQWAGFHHIIDPESLESPDRIAGTWVIAEDTMTADGISTALFLTDPKKLAQFDFAYAILYKDMSFEHSDNFPVKAFEAA